MKRKTQKHFHFASSVPSESFFTRNDGAINEKNKIKPIETQTRSSLCSKKSHFGATVLPISIPEMACVCSHLCETKQKRFVDVWKGRRVFRSPLWVRAVRLYLWPKRRKEKSTAAPKDLKFYVSCELLWVRLKCWTRMLRRRGKWRVECCVFMIPLSISYRILWWIST